MNVLLSEESFSCIDFSLCPMETVNSFLSAVNGKTVGHRINEAIEQRSKGHFNDAMSGMSEANRLHVQAIRNIQKWIDLYKGAARTEVIFEKYRQKAPFQVGLRNGDTVITLLNQINCDRVVSESFHKDEMALVTLAEELHFYETRMAGRVPESETESVRKSLLETEKRIQDFKEQCVTAAFTFVSDHFPKLDCSDRVFMVTDFYTLLTSSIETVHAGDVGVADVVDVDVLN